MNILSDGDIQNIIKQYNFENVDSWRLEKYSDKLLGYLGEYLRLKIKAKNSAGIIADIICFVKCVPQSDPTKANLLKKCNFFAKEYKMLADLLLKLGCNQGDAQWYPKSLLLKENVFVSEDVVVKGFKTIEESQYEMSYEQIRTVVELLAKFNARCFIYEEKRSKLLGRQYRLWEDYSDHLKEPGEGLSWRNAGKNAAVHYLNLFSKYRTNPDFSKNIESIMTQLFSRGLEQLQPSTKYRNAICHRDLWKNNVFFKKQSNGKYFGLIIDFQTVVYAMPLIDLSSLLYFNTNKLFRKKYTEDLLDLYFNTLKNELSSENINVLDIIDKPSLLKAYDEHSIFGITQAAIVVPIVALKNETGIKYFNDPETVHTVNNVCRNDIFAKVAKFDDAYRCRLTELLDEIVEKYVINS